MPKSHDKAIFDHYNEDMDTRYTLEEQQEEPTITFERNFTPLEYSYDSILQKMLDNWLITLSDSRSYGNPYMKVYFSYHQHNDRSTLNCMELNHKIQDLNDYKIFSLEAL